MEGNKEEKQRENGHHRRNRAMVNDVLFNEIRQAAAMTTCLIKSFSVS